MIAKNGIEFDPNGIVNYDEYVSEHGMVQTPPRFTVGTTIVSQRTGFQFKILRIRIAGTSSGVTSYYYRGESFAPGHSYEYRDFGFSELYKALNHEEIFKKITALVESHEKFHLINERGRSRLKSKIGIFLNYASDVNQYVENYFQMQNVFLLKAKEIRQHIPEYSLFKSTYTHFELYTKLKEMGVIE
jgi:hypothetical protein